MSKVKADPKADHRVRCNVWVCKDCEDDFDHEQVIRVIGMLQGGFSSEEDSAEEDSLEELSSGEEEGELDGAEEDRDPDGSQDVPVVVNILEQRNSKQDGDIVEVLVRWSTQKQDTWEQEHELNCPKLLKAFWLAERRLLQRGMAEPSPEQGDNFASESDEMQVPWRERHILWADVVPVVQVLDGDPTNKMRKTIADQSQPPRKMATTELGQENAKVFDKLETKGDSEAMPVPTAEEEEAKQRRRSRLPPLVHTECDSQHQFTHYCTLQSHIVPGSQTFDPIVTDCALQLQIVPRMHCL